MTGLPGYDPGTPAGRAVPGPAYQPVGRIPATARRPAAFVDAVKDLPGFKAFGTNERITPNDLTLPDGTPMVGADGFLIPPARSFSMVVNSAQRVYSYRFDEAMRDNFVNARAMLRDAFNWGLLWERWYPTINRKWQLEVDDARAPVQKMVRDALAKAVQQVRGFDMFKQALLMGSWWGRAGTAWTYRRDPDCDDMWAVSNWDPVHGDSVQFTFDGHPAILMDSMTAGWYAHHGATRGPFGDLRSTDRGGMALVLHRPQWRDRYAIYQHTKYKADFFEGELAGSVQGFGLRGMVYWHYVIRTDALTWMLTYMQAVGAMDLLVFNYPWGDAAAQLNAENNAKRIIGKAAIAMPRNPQSNWPAVEQVSMNSEGLKALHDLIAEYFDRHIERLIVGQSMSAGADNESGLGGTGRADFARATKDEILLYDSNRLDDTVTRDLIGPLKKYNFPWAKFPVRFKSVFPDTDAKDKVASGQTMISAGVSVKVDEFREAAGYSRPEPGDETVGGPQTAGMGQPPGSNPNAPMHVTAPGMGGGPGQPPGQPPPGGTPTPQPPGGPGPHFGAPPAPPRAALPAHGHPPALGPAVGPARFSGTDYVTDAHGMEHRDAGPGGGQFTSGGNTTGTTGAVGRATTRPPTDPETARRAETVLDSLPTLPPDEHSGAGFGPELRARDAGFSKTGVMTIFGVRKPGWFSVEHVPIDKIIPSQHHVPVEGVRAYLRHMPDELPAVAFDERDGSYHAMDHTRIVAAALLGQIPKVKVYRFALTTDRKGRPVLEQVKPPKPTPTRNDAGGGGGPSGSGGMGFPGGGNTYIPGPDRDYWRDKPVGFTRFVGTDYVTDSHGVEHRDAGPGGGQFTSGGSGGTTAGGRSPPPTGPQEAFDRFKYTTARVFGREPGPAGIVEIPLPGDRFVRTWIKPAFDRAAGDFRYDVRLDFGNRNMADTDVNPELQADSVAMLRKVKEAVKAYHTAGFSLEIGAADQRRKELYTRILQKMGLKLRQSGKDEVWYEGEISGPDVSRQPGLSGVVRAHGGGERRLLYGTEVYEGTPEWDTAGSLGTYYEVKHAPPGGVTVAGKKFVGGQFIPGDVMAKASPAERAAVESGGAAPVAVTTGHPAVEPAAVAPAVAGPRSIDFSSPAAFAASLSAAVAGGHPDPEESARRAEAAARVAAALPPAVVARLSRGRLKAVVPTADVRATTGRWYAAEAAETGRAVPEVRQEQVLGYYDEMSCELVMDGGPDPAGTLAHELGHALDQSDDLQSFELSGTQEWKSYWSREIKSTGNLTRYAATDEVEGFAEFCRLLWGSGPGGARDAAESFPMCYSFFQRRGLVGPPVAT